MTEFAAKQNAPVVAICAKTEAELADEDKLLFLQDMGQDEPGLNRLIRSGFSLLGQIGRASCRERVYSSV